MKKHIALLTALLFYLSVLPVYGIDYNKFNISDINFENFGLMDNTYKLSAPYVDVRAYAPAGTLIIGAVDWRAYIKAAIDNAISTGSKCISFPPGDYLWVTKDDALDYTKWLIPPGANGLTLEGYGATITQRYYEPMHIGAPSIDVNRHCTDPFDVGTCTGWPNIDYAQYYHIDNALIGALTVTTTTASDAGNFSAGDNVWLSSGDASSATGHPPREFEFNEVVSAVAGTGVITLKHRLRGNYNHTADTPYTPGIVKANDSVSNITIKGFRFRKDTSVAAGAYGYGPLIDIENARNITFEDVTFDGQLWNSYSQNITYRNCTFNGPTDNDRSTTDWGDASRDVKVFDSTFTRSPKHHVQFGYAAHDYRIERNTFYGYSDQGSTGYCAVFATGLDNTHMNPRNAIISNNIIYLPSQSLNSCGIMVKYLIGPKVQDNKIYGTSDGSTMRAIALQYDVINGLFTGNLIDITGTTGYGFALETNSSGHSIDNNIFANNRVLGGEEAFMFGSGGTYSKNIISTNLFNSLPLYSVDARNLGTGNMWIGNMVNGFYRMSASDKYNSNYDIGTSLFYQSPLGGSATIDNTSTTEAVAFTTAQLDNNYRISIAGQDNTSFWVTGKSTAGFTINRANSVGDVLVDWTVIRP